MLRRRGAVLVGSFALFTVACPGPPPSHPTPPAEPRLAWLDPCGGCSPLAYCAPWVIDAERACSRDDDCVEIRIDYGRVDCPWGLWGGGGPSFSASKAAEEALRARMAKEDVCVMQSHLGGTGPCRPPPIACVEHLCRYAEGPNFYAL